ncbi:hypothetical protein BJX61DRAFT_510354, partial [Aspergillus egyptiacus]
MLLIVGIMLSHGVDLMNGCMIATVPEDLGLNLGIGHYWYSWSLKGFSELNRRLHALARLKYHASADDGCPG